MLRRWKHVLLVTRGRSASYGFFLSILAIQRSIHWLILSNLLLLNAYLPCLLGLTHQYHGHLRATSASLVHTLDHVESHHETSSFHFLSQLHLISARPSLDCRIAPRKMNALLAHRAEFIRLPTKPVRLQTVRSSLTKPHQYPHLLLWLFKIKNSLLHLYSTFNI